MSIKQYLYNIKQSYIAKNTPKLNIAEGEKIVVAENCDLKEFEKFFSDYVVVGSVSQIAEKDYGKIEIFFGAPPKKSLPEMTSLKWLQLSSAGMNGYDDKALYKTDVKVTGARGVYGLPISECVIGDILFLMKPAMANTINKKYSIPALSGKDFTGSTVIVCGLGDIGKNIALRCKGMQCEKVIGFDKFVTDCEGVDEIYPLDKLNELIGQADIIASALPAVPETDGVFNEKTFSLMKQDAIFVNVGRGNAVNQEALLKAVNSKKLFGAALDATTPDPLPKNHPLRKNGRILITDHLACISSKNKDRLQSYYLAQAERYIKGEKI
ncbi:MAG: D-2-hydroxyacid dehydrogenase [Clostridia bacterium]|nr:D-2-hydroxyacid dehydrogenase [Clostridia bacterium]